MRRSQERSTNEGANQSGFAPPPLPPEEDGVTGMEPLDEELELLLDDELLEELDEDEELDELLELDDELELLDDEEELDDETAASWTIALELVAEPAELVTTTQ